MSGKLSEIYKYNILGETSYDRGNNWKSKFEYDEDALYSTSMKVAYFNKNKEGISNNGVIGKYFTNDFRIRYFDNKILCIEKYIDWFGGEAHGEIWYNYYAILSLKTGKKLNYDFYKDLIYYNEEYKEFLKNNLLNIIKI